MKKATKASDNRYYQARFSAAQKNTDFESREAASDVVGIDLNPSTLFPIMRKPLNCGLRKTLRIFNGCILHNLP